MWFDEVVTYIRENYLLVMMAFAGVVILCLLVILFQVSRTHRKVNKICKKIRKYFDVILTEEVQADVAENKTALQNQTQNPEAVSVQRQEESLKKQKDAELLMEVISDVF